MLQVGLNYLSSFLNCSICSYNSVMFSELFSQVRYSYLIPPLSPKRLINFFIFYFRSSGGSWVLRGRVLLLFYRNLILIVDKLKWPKLYFFLNLWQFSKKNYSKNTLLFHFFSKFYRGSATNFFSKKNIFSRYIWAM